LELAKNEINGREIWAQRSRGAVEVRHGGTETLNAIQVQELGNVLQIATEKQKDNTSGYPPDRNAKTLGKRKDW